MNAKSVWTEAPTQYEHMQHASMTVYSRLIVATITHQLVISLIHVTCSSLAIPRRASMYSRAIVTMQRSRRMESFGACLSRTLLDIEGEKFQILTYSSSCLLREPSITNMLFQVGVLGFKFL